LRCARDCARAIADAVTGSRWLFCAASSDAVAVMELGWELRQPYQSASPLRLLVLAAADAAPAAPALLCCGLMPLRLSRLPCREFEFERASASCSSDQSAIGLPPAMLPLPVVAAGLPPPPPPPAAAAECCMLMPKLGLLLKTKDGEGEPFGELTADPPPPPPPPSRALPLPPPPP
jgi:hypothetical protein